jgi:hypothetical protein
MILSVGRADGQHDLSRRIVRRPIIRLVTAYGKSFFRRTAIPQLPQGNGEGRRPGGTRDSHRGLIRAPALGFWEPEGGDVWYEAALLGLADTAPGASVRLRRPHAVGQ